MPGNTLGFLLSLVKLFEEAELPVWVFGGWAEELWQITPPGTHRDIDFLYPGETFEHLDCFLTRTEEFQEIPAKRFSHKRAILYRQVMIEFLLVQSANGNHFTDFFSGRYHLAWPIDVFHDQVHISGCKIPISSKQALAMYRQQHEQVEKAYWNFSQNY